jgi:hypothetical protein
MGFKKAKTIIQAFTEPLPVDQTWYQERLAICAKCPLNSVNKVNLTMAEKFNVANLIKKGLCDEGNHCTACGCCIERKCATRSEDCGKVKLDEAPEWRALDAPSKINPQISMENVTPEMGQIEVQDTQFDYNFGVSDKERLTFAFRIRRDEAEFKLKNFRPGCSCTSVDNISDAGKNATQFNVSVSTKGFRKGWNSRKLFITHFINSGKEEEITINIKVNKPNGK